MKRRIVHFFDRDGVINRRIVGDYIRKPDQFSLLQDIADALVATKRKGRLAIVVTNQRGIARNLMSANDLYAVHDRMQWEVERTSGFRFDDILFCPHGDDIGCSCRKPNPGMLLQAAENHGIDLRRSWMIGDSISDIVAGQRAGCRTLRLAPGYQEDRYGADPTILADGLKDGLAAIIAADEGIG